MTHYHSDGEAAGFSAGIIVALALVLAVAVIAVLAIARPWGSGEDQPAAPIEVTVDSGDDGEDEPGVTATP